MTTSRAAISSVVALILGVATLSPMAEPAGAAPVVAPTVTNVTRNPSTLVVTGSGHSAWMTVSAHVVSPGGDATVQWALEQHPGSYADDGNLTGFMHLTSGTKRDGRWSVTWRATNAVRIGRFARLDVHAIASSGSSPWISAGVTSIKVRTTASITVYPTHPKKGKRYGVYSFLKHIRPYVNNATGVRYRQMTNTRISFEFNPKGPGGWRVVKTKLTGSANTGAHINVTARKSGQWRVRYKGDATNAACLSVFRRVTVT